MNSIKINPTTITKYVASFKIDVLYLIINTKALIRVTMFDDEDNVVDQQQFELIKPDYDEWLTDDNLIFYVCQKYNFSLYNI